MYSGKFCIEVAFVQPEVPGMITPCVTKANRMSENESFMGFDARIFFCLLHVRGWCGRWCGRDAREGHWCSMGWRRESHSVLGTQVTRGIMHKRDAVGAPIFMFY